MFFAGGIVGHLMTLFEVGVVFLGLGLVIAFLVLLGIIGFVYKKLREKYEDIEQGKKELQDHINRVNEARVSEMKQLHARLEALEEKLGVVLQPEGPHKELAKEKLRAHARK